MFKENDLNYKMGINELEKIVKNYFDKNGFQKSRNPEEVFICIKFLIEIFFFEKIFVIDDKTPGWSFTSILKYDEQEWFNILNFSIFFLT